MESTIYCHSSKDSNYEMAHEIGRGQDAKFLENFLYTGYEVAFDVIIHDDGKVTATHVNGVALTEPVRI